jgi:concentrative nucleoside transporter, CNT family
VVAGVAARIFALSALLWGLSCPLPASALEPDAPPAISEATGPVGEPPSEGAPPGAEDPGPPDAPPVTDAASPGEAVAPGEPAPLGGSAEGSPPPPGDPGSTGSGVATGKGNYRPAPSGLAIWGYRGISLVGVFAFLGVGWLLSEGRRDVRWRPVIWGVALQLVFGAIVLGLGASEYIYDAVNYLVGVLLKFAEAGSAFVFASFIPHQVDVIGPDGFQPVTYGLARSDADNWPPATRNVAFAVLPTIIFFSALMSLLYYLGVMAPVVRAIAWLMVRTLGTSGSESLSAAGNIFVGQTEAPLLVKPFVATMTRSELMAVMTGGFATVAGGVLGVYVMLLQDALPSIAGHLVVASILSAPAALAMAKMMVPETAQSLTAGEVQLNVEQPASNFIEAAATGATDGMKLVLNVVAMLIAIVALVAMVNWAISWVPLGLCGDGSAGFGYAVTCASGESARPLDLSMILGVAFFPAAVLMGVPVEDWMVVGQLLGEKIVLTELLAYKSLAALVSGPEPVLSQRAAIIASYALCGFANFASIGIQLGGIGGIAPDRMGELAQLGFRAMIAGALAACMTGAVAGVFL